MNNVLLTILTTTCSAKNFNLSHKKATKSDLKKDKKLQ